MLTLPFQSPEKQDQFIEKILHISRKKAGMKVAQASAGDLDISYLERTGDNTLPTVVLIHGFSANKDHWMSFSQMIDKKYRIIVPDLAGHGDSDGDHSTYYGLVKQAERLKTFLDSINVTQCHILGNSMGGAISALFYHQHPDMINSIGLMDTAGIEGETPSEFFEALNLENPDQGNNLLIPETIQEHKRFMKWVMHKPPFLPWPFAGIIARQALERTALNKKVFEDMVKTREQMLVENFEKQLLEVIQEKKTPTLVMWGEKDNVLDISAAYRIQELAPHAELIILEDIGHLPMIECPEKSGQLYSIMSFYLALSLSIFFL